MRTPAGADVDGVAKEDGDACGRLKGSLEGAQKMKHESCSSSESVMVIVSGLGRASSFNRALLPLSLAGEWERVEGVLVVDVLSGPCINAW